MKKRSSRVLAWLSSLSSPLPLRERATAEGRGVRGAFTRLLSLTLIVLLASCPGTNPSSAPTQGGPPSQMPGVGGPGQAPGMGGGLSGEQADGTGDPDDPAGSESEVAGSGTYSGGNFGGSSSSSTVAGQGGGGSGSAPGGGSAGLAPGGGGGGGGVGGAGSGSGAGGSGAGGGGGSWWTNPGGASGGGSAPAGPGGGAEAGNPVEPLPTGGGGDPAMPPVTIAPPTARQERTVVAAADSQEHNPCLGYEDAIPEEARDGNHAIYCGPDELERVSFAPSLLRFKNPQTRFALSLRKKGNTEFVGGLSSPIRDIQTSRLPDIRTLFIPTSRLPDIRTFFIPSAYAMPVVLVPLSKNIDGQKSKDVLTSRLPDIQTMKLTPFANKQPILLQRAARRRPQFGVAQNICNTSGVGCCTIAADGSFQCYPQSDNETTLCIQVVNIVTGAVSECVNEDPNRNFLWMRQKPVANTPGLQLTEKVLFAVGDPPATNNNVVKITEDEGAFMVDGDWTRHYKHEEVNAYDAKGIAFDPLLEDAGLLSLRRPTTSINLHEVLMLDEVNSVAASFEMRTIPDTRTYTVLKLASNGKTMIGREPNTATDRDWIYYAPDTTLFDPTPGISEDIQFLTGADGIDQYPGEAVFMKHKITHAFDVDGDYAIVVWEDDRGNLRLRMSNGNPDRTREVTLATTGSHNIKDLQLYQPNDSGDRGQIVILNAGRNELKTASFNHEMGAPVSLTLEDTVSLPAGSAAEAFVLNAEKNKAYVINKGRESVTVVDLKNEGGTPLAVPVISREVNVEDYFPDKDFTYKPTHASYHASTAGDALVIGMEDMKGSLVLPIASLARPASPSRSPIRDLPLFNGLKKNNAPLIQKGTTKSPEITKTPSKSPDLKAGLGK